jgi:hypothetical protein
MSGFYGQLAKEALGDDVSDVSEGELDEFLAVYMNFLYKHFATFSKELSHNINLFFKYQSKLNFLF